MIDVTVDDGKYRIIQEDGRLRFERHGEPWLDNAALLPGSKMIIAMACEIEELRKLKAKALEIAGCLKDDGGYPRFTLFHGGETDKTILEFWALLGIQPDNEEDE